MKIIKKNKNFIYCLLLSFLVLLFTSKHSYLYVFNDWMDANAFFTMGKSMMNGIVPYRDLFEQKGLILYVIYGIGYLMNNNSFHGVFILEIISFSVYLYYASKIIKMYLDKKYVYLILPLFALITTTTISFVQGGSCEEFMLPYLMISFYYFIRHFKEKELNNKEIIINGIMAGIVFMMKYTVIGFFMGFVLFIFIDYLVRKDIKKAFLLCIKYLIGMFIPILLCLIYLLINHAFIDFFNDYFIINVTSYSNFTGINKILKIFNTFKDGIICNGRVVFFLTILIPLSIFSINKNIKKLGIYIIGLFFITGLVIFFGLRLYYYYSLPLIIFTIISLITIFSLFDVYIKKLFTFKYDFLIYILIFLLIIPLSYFNANYKEEIGNKKEDYYQFKYADYISKSSNQTILNYGSLDVGVSTILGTLPNIKHFETQNIDYERYKENIDEMQSYIMNKKTNFVIYVTDNLKNYYVSDHIYENYNEVYKDIVNYEEYILHVYLFELKNKCPVDNS